MTALTICFAAGKLLIEEFNIIISDVISTVIQELRIQALKMHVLQVLGV